jgi:hypothetical protein
VMSLFDSVILIVLFFRCSVTTQVSQTFVMKSFWIIPFK